MPLPLRFRLLGPGLNNSKETTMYFGRIGQKPWNDKASDFDHIAHLFFGQA